MDGCQGESRARKLGGKERKWREKVSVCGEYVGIVCARMCLNMYVCAAYLSIVGRCACMHICTLMSMTAFACMSMRMSTHS